MTTPQSPRPAPAGEVVKPLFPNEMDYPSLEQFEKMDATPPPVAPVAREETAAPKKPLGMVTLADQFPDTPMTDAAAFDRDEDCSICDDEIVTADFARSLERRLHAAEAERDKVIQALDNLLNTSAVITPHDAQYKEDFVDLQVRGDYYEAAYKLLEKYETSRTDSNS